MNFKDVNTENTIESIPEGRYPVTLTKVEEKISGNGNKYVKIECTVNAGKWKNRKAWASVVVEDGKLVFAAKLAKAVGANALFDKDSFTITDYANAIRNKSCEAFIENKANPNTGKTSPSASNFSSFPASGSMASVTVEDTDEDSVFS